MTCRKCRQKATCKIIYLLEQYKLQLLENLSQTIFCKQSNHQFIILIYFPFPCHYISLGTSFIISWNKKARSICTYGRARTCVIIVGTASLIYNIPRFLEVTWTTQEVCGINRTIPFATDLRMNLTYVKYVRN